MASIEATSAFAGPAPAGWGERLLDWYDRHHRELPWRLAPGGRAAKANPYRVWLSEIMLQQTTVEAVKPYYARFLQLWPDIGALAAAPQEDVMKAWAGLGYYSRARNLKACAERVVAEHGGRFPDTEDGLRALPGIGAYTAAAIAAIAFRRPAIVIDGNVERVASRLDAIETPLPAAKAEIRQTVEAGLVAGRAGDFAQAMMDLGATICTPRRPGCMICPISSDCAALRAGDPERYPVRPPKADRPLRTGAAYVAIREDGAILLRRRPDRGLLGGMTEVPTSGWTARLDGAADISAAPLDGDWVPSGTVDHIFTHFALRLSVYRAAVGGVTAPADHWWSVPGELAQEALPTVMRKAIEAAVPGATKRPRGKT
jgi:A/G-specific adenine glycosylase